VNGFDDDAVIANNVIIGIDDREAVSCGTRYQPTAPVFRFNDVYNPWGPLYGGTCGDLTGVASNVSVDPLFVDAAGGDYHLHSESPLVDAGSNAVVQLLETDFDGDSRILDGDGVGEAVVDMGFDEVARGIMSFATLTSKTRITRRGVGRDRIVIRGTFTVAASSSGIALQIEQLQLVLEDGSATVFRYEPPPASFVRLGSGERYGSTTSMGSAVVYTTIAAGKSPGEFKFRIRARDLQLNSVPSNELTLTLRIGDDAGADTVPCVVRGASLRCP